ncbi:hypothetical protein, partial [Brucella cytisi]|uniref:hypothetical protein n=1 Tax=Brucella cytisi TaxID=407152 RepID=UPI0019821B0C
LSKIIRYRCGHPTLASIQPASVNQNKTDLGSAFDSEKNGNALGQIKNNIIFRSGDLFQAEHFYLMANVKQQ